MGAQIDLAAGQKRRTRWFIFVILLYANFCVWLLSSKMGLLAPFWSKDLGIDPVGIGEILAAYLLGYFPLLLICGVLADWVGAKRMIIICLVGVIGVSAWMTFVHTRDELWMRNLIFGIFFGFLWAPINKLMGQWFPAKELTTVTAIWMGSVLGTGIVAGPLALPIAARFGWQAAFWAIVALSIPALILFWIFVTEKPEQNKSMSAEEKAYIAAGRFVESGEKVSLSDQIKALWQPSVLLMSIAAGTATVPTWMLSWTSYGVITLEKINPDTLAAISPFFTLILVILSFFNGWMLSHLARGRTKVLLAAGQFLCAAGFFAAGLIPMNWILWLFCLSVMGFLSDITFWGTVNTYWAGLVGAKYLGTVGGVSAALQVAIGWYLTNNSGTWLDTSATGLAQLSPLWIIGGAIYVFSAIPVFFCKPVNVPVEAPKEAVPTAATS